MTWTVEWDPAAAADPTTGRYGRDRSITELARGFAPVVLLFWWMQSTARITHDAKVMGGRPCIRGLRVTVGTIVGLLAAGKAADEILAAYPYLEREDIRAALEYAAWRSEEIDLPLTQ